MKGKDGRLKGYWEIKDGRDGRGTWNKATRR